ncbi:MAG: nucleotidyltransferase domain-containing protein [Bacillota bacterium]
MGYPGKINKSKEQVLIQQCRNLIKEILPNSTIILYGSRARGDAGTDSDYDLLVITKGPVDWHLEEQIRDKIYPLELETGAVLSLIAFSEEDWNSPIHQATPFNQNVRREGITL